MATYYIAKSPFSGKWLRRRFAGSSPNIADAFPYHEDNHHLAIMVKTARDHGYKLKLRQVSLQSIKCPTCTGTGYQLFRPYYDCDDCDGTGTTNV